MRDEREGVVQGIDLRWMPTTPIEKLMGTKGQILAAFDVRPLIGKPPSALQPALPAGYVFQNCIEVSCNAFGPAAPGGWHVHVIQATFRGGETQVSITASPKDTPRVVALLEASLGKLQPYEKRGWAEYHVVRNGGITYFVTIRRGVHVYIPHHQPAERMED